MLVQLAVRDIVLIDQLVIDLADGLTVLTGETGAGKSILLDAFSLALGGRGDGGLVREGASQGQVTAVFDLPGAHPARGKAAEAGIDTDGDLILRRVQMRDGRTRAFVNDQPASVQALRAIGAAAVEIHGQHDERALLDGGEHRALLDAFGGLGPQLGEVASLYRDWRGAERRLADQRARIEKAKADIDYLRHAADELGKLAPEPGEEEELAQRRHDTQQAEKVASELADTLEVVSGQHAPGPALSLALRRLERRAAQAPALVEPVTAALDRVLVALDEASAAVDAALRETEFEPAELERIEERLFALRAAGRKYNKPVDDLAGERARFERELAAIDAGEEAVALMESETRMARSHFETAARLLSDGRHRAAASLDHAVNAELPPLKLDRARFMTEVATDIEHAAPEGVDRAEFRVQTNPGTRPGPIMKVASGGELSRFLLALKVALADRGSAPTLVFDEIDSGVGGAVSDAIGQRLARLAERVQVLCVTHAPQVAARADAHFLIAKELAGDGGSVITRVRPLPEGERREEIARMLAGETITTEARAAAERLLKAAV